MNEARIEAALRAMGQMTPRAPEKTVEGMINKIRALNAKKQKLAARAEGRLPRHRGGRSAAILRRMPKSWDFYARCGLDWQSPCTRMKDAAIRKGAST